jgi:hypothetical protein
MLDTGLPKALGYESMMGSDRGARVFFLSLWLWGLVWILVGFIQALPAERAIAADRAGIAAFPGI